MKKYFDKISLIFVVVMGICLVAMIILLARPILTYPVLVFDMKKGTFDYVYTQRKYIDTPFTSFNRILIPQTAVFCSIALVFLVFAVLLTIRLARKGMFADMKAKIHANRKPTKAEQIADLQKQIDELKQQQNKKD